jgi:NADH-quinone oxidoreductase subunit H
MLNVSAVATTLFFGGWRAPVPLSLIGDGVLNTGWWPLLWFLAKVWMFMFLFVWVRGTLLRLRYDQFMRFGWKILIPAALISIVAVAGVQGVRRFTDIDLRTMLLVLAGVAVVGVVISFLVPEKKPEPAAGPPPFDAFADGYPVPPLPGQTMPASPRRLRMAAAQAVTVEATTAVLEAGPAGEEEMPRG